MLGELNGDRADAADPASPPDPASTNTRSPGWLSAGL
jgi:hypothetical protein